MKTILKLFFLALLAGCIKDKDLGGLLTIINLTVIDEFSGESLMSEKFEFIDCNNKLTLKNDCWNTNDIFSDSLGKAIFEFTNEVDRNYSLKYRPNGSWKEFKHMSPIYHRIDEGKTNNITFKLRPTSQLGIHFKHNPTTEFTRMSYSVRRFTGNDDGFSDWLGFQGTSFKELNQSIDTIIYRTVMQEESYSINASLQKATEGFNKINKDVGISRVDTLVVEFEF